MSIVLSETYIHIYAHTIKESTFKMMMVTEEHNNNNDVDNNDNSPDDTSIPEEDIGATVVMTGLPVSLDMGDEKVRASLDSFFSDLPAVKIRYSFVDNIF